MPKYFKKLNVSCNTQPNLKVYTQPCDGGLPLDNAFKAAFNPQKGGKAKRSYKKRRQTKRNSNKRNKKRTLKRKIKRTFKNKRQSGRGRNIEVKVYGGSTVEELEANQAALEEIREDEAETEDNITSESPSNLEPIPSSMADGDGNNLEPRPSSMADGDGNENNLEPRPSSMADENPDDNEQDDNEQDGNEQETDTVPTEQPTGNEPEEPEQNPKEGGMFSNLKGMFGL